MRLWEVLCCTGLCALAGLGQTVYAQPSLRVGGLTYFDYFYQWTSVDEAREGQNGFTYRRVYLTTDYEISQAFSGRVRLEANEETVVGGGPISYIKDLYLTWESEAGHALSFGVTSPPVFLVSEAVWGYRSLEETSMDLFGIVSSRDMGVRAEGPLLPGGGLRYMVMVGNNEGTRPENDKHKRVYAQLQHAPEEAFAFTAGVDYAAGERADGLTFNGFAGYRAEAFQGGLEGFWNHADVRGEGEIHQVGLSLFGTLHLHEAWDVVGRIDRARTQVQPGAPFTFYSTFVLVGVAYIPHPQVRFIPNLHLMKRDDADAADLLGRVTLEFSF